MLSVTFFFSLSLSGQPAAKHVIKWSQGQNEFHTEVGALLRCWEADKTFSPNDTPLAVQGSSSSMDTGSAVLIMEFRRCCCSHPPGNWTGVLWADESRRSWWRRRRWAKCTRRTLSLEGVAAVVGPVSAVELFTWLFMFSLHHFMGATKQRFMLFPRVKLLLLLLLLLQDESGVKK